MTSRRSSKEKDPIGTTVFCPNSLPPPPRRSSRSSAQSPDSPSPGQPPRPSPSISPRISSLGPLGAAGPTVSYDNDGEVLFPRQPSSDTSPPSQLTSMLENWNFFTPSPGSSISRLPGLIASDSAADLAILSPNALPLSDLIDEAFIQDDSSPSRPPRVATTPPKIHSFIDSPAPRAGQFTTKPFRRPAARGQGGFLLGSPQPLPPSPLSGPIPFRQPSWSANTGARRASVPNASVRVAGPFASPLYGNHSSVSRGSLPSQSPRDPPSFAPDTQTNQGELFSPVYTLASPSWAPATQYTFPPRTPENTLDLHFDEVFAAGPSQEHTHQPTHRSISDDPNSSQVAAQYLRNRSLNPEFVKRYEVHDELGSGAFGFVCSAVQTGHGNILGKEVAVKFIFKDRIAECDQGLIHGEPVESYVLSRCNHPNIIAFRSLFEDPDFYYLVQELHGDPWAPGHTLEPKSHVYATASVPEIPVLALGQSFAPGSVLSGSPASDWSGWSPNPAAKRPNMARRASHDLFEAVEHQRFTEDQARTIFRQIASAVSYLHKRGIYHRDLKDENIVIDRNLQVKIIDFGSAVFENRQCPPVVHDHFRGTMSYASAEVLSGMSYHARPADIWALGIILGIVLTGESPFPSTPYAQVGRIKMKRQISASSYDLLARCLHTNPERRATIETIESHRWLRVPMIHRGSVLGLVLY